MDEQKKDKQDLNSFLSSSDSQLSESFSSPVGSPLRFSERTFGWGSPVIHPENLRSLATPPPPPPPPPPTTTITKPTNIPLKGGVVVKGEAGRMSGSAPTLTVWQRNDLALMCSESSYPF